MNVRVFVIVVCAAVLCCRLRIQSRTRIQTSRPAWSISCFPATGKRQTRTGRCSLETAGQVGIAFAPSDAKLRSLPEAEKVKLLERTRPPSCASRMWQL